MAWPRTGPIRKAGTKGYAGVSASSEYDAKIAVLRQLLAWGSDLTGSAQRGLFEDRIYVLTPDAAVIELPQGATPVDFAYSVHTSLGHRCRGARVDGVMVPLNTALESGADRRDQHRQRRSSFARLAQCGPGLSGQQPRQGQGARLVQCSGHA